MRQFIEAPGKAMIVGGTREICARLYDAIVALRPDWHADDARQGQDQGRLLRHAGRRRADRQPRPTDSENAAIKKRLKDVDDELEIVIVKDMMLTGYDSPPLHTLYLDRPLKGALLMQTLARVNRTFRGKEDGLLVAYAPLADNLAEGAGGVHRRRPGEQAGRPQRRRGGRRSSRSWSSRSASCWPDWTGGGDACRGSRGPT